MSERASHAPQPENPYAQLADTVQALSIEQAGKLEQSYVDAVTVGEEAAHPLHTEAVQALRADLDTTSAAVAVKEGDSEVARLEAVLKNPLLSSEERSKFGQELADVQMARQLYAEDQQENADVFRVLLNGEAHDKAVEDAKWEDFFLGDTVTAKAPAANGSEQQLEDLAVEKSKELVDGTSDKESATEAPEAEAEPEVEAPAPAPEVEAPAPEPEVEAEPAPAPAESAPAKNRYEQETPQERERAAKNLLDTVDQLADWIHQARSNKNTDPTYNNDKVWQANLKGAIQTLVARLPYLEDGQLNAVYEQLIDRARKNVQEGDEEIGRILSGVTFYTTHEVVERLRKNGEDVTEDTLQTMLNDADRRINEPFARDLVKAEEPAHPDYDGPVTAGMELAVSTPAPKKKLRQKVGGGLKKVAASPVKGAGAIVRGVKERMAANHRANVARAAAESERRSAAAQTKNQAKKDQQNPEQAKAASDAARRQVQVFLDARAASKQAEREEQEIDA